jgi:hypothetical protein
VVFDPSNQTMLCIVGLVGLAVPARNVAATMSVPPAAVPASDPKVFYVGMQKAGTTSFASFCYYSLNLTSLHATAYSLAKLNLTKQIYQTLFINHAVCQAAQASRPTDIVYPDHDTWMREADMDNLDTMLNAPGVNCYADLPWYLYWRHIEATVPNAKFVVWERDSASWYESLYNDFCVDRPWLCGPTLAYLWEYGTCYLNGTTAKRDAIGAYENHLAELSEYFSSTSERAERFLTIDYTAQGSAQRLCDFVLGAPACAHVNATADGLVPDVEPPVDVAMNLEAARVLDHALARAGRAAPSTSGRHLIS